MAEKSIICFDYPLMDESNENSRLLGSRRERKIGSLQRGERG